ncbi:DUF2812 domain-containing protein [Paenisporosarcina antarctica]|uniref:DUF2812 domain-containing protein n=1 Tax=Paenisporosarcina antarctica TaxID=417367 RepID=A0A4P7A362_9BACL|nr:DUF2812 domain-containing protein [Paenisporosarcina antarctica]QBP42416.1 DUF2812 domain-containing protein [Paenisporosarcina antarctica]
MTTKKWRPLWSYDTEKTEPWLSNLSSQGNRLISVNRFTRMFTFEQGPAEDVQFQVVYDKSRKTLSKVIMESNWEEVFYTGNWRFLKNDSKGVSIYPSREGLLKRNRIHFYVLAGLAMFCVMPFLMMFLLIWTLLTDINSVEPSPYWWITAVYFMSVISVLVLTIFTAIKLKAFERKYFNSAVDDNEVSGKTFTKWRFAWMYEPDKLEKWLSEMAAEGNHLIRVGKIGTNFIFEKGTPSHVSFVCDYQIKTTPSYADIHKSAGWQLKFTSPYSLTKHSLWSQEYAEGEDIPRFTYDDAEQKAQVRKVLLASTGVIMYTLAIIFIYLWMGQSFERQVGWNVHSFIEWAMIISLLSPLMIMIKTFNYAIRMRSVN